MSINTTCGGDVMHGLGQGLTNLFDWLAKYNTTLTLLVAFFGMVATVIYAGLTVRLVRETIQLRKSGTNPDIAIYFEPYEKSISLINLVIRNVGSGAAYRLAFTVEQVPPLNPAISQRLSEIALFNGFKYMAPGQELRYFFGVAWELLQEPGTGAVNIGVTYESKGRERQHESFTLDLRDFNGMVQLGTPPLHDIAKHVQHLAGIAKALDKINARQERSVVSRTSVVADNGHVSSNAQTIRARIHRWKHRLEHSGGG